MKINCFNILFKVAKINFKAGNASIGLKQIC